MTPQDEDHLRILSILYFVSAGLEGLIGLLPILHIGMGIMMLTDPSFMSGPPASPPPPAPFGYMPWLFIVVGTFAVLFVETVAICQLLTGLYLRRRKRRMFCFVVACISCIRMPIGTALGVFTLIVLSRQTVKAGFDAASVAPTPEAPYPTPLG